MYDYKNSLHNKKLDFNQKAPIRKRSYTIIFCSVKNGHHDSSNQ